MWLYFNVVGIILISIIYLTSFGELKYIFINGMLYYLHFMYRKVYKLSILYLLKWVYKNIEYGDPPFFLLFTVWDIHMLH